MGTTSIWIIGDQLLDTHPAWVYAQQQAQNTDTLRVLYIESHRRLRAQPYQRKKLVLLLSAMRHHAQQMRERGFEVDVVQADTFRDGIHDHIRRHRPEQIVSMASASYQGRRSQQQLAEQLSAEGITFTIVPNTQFLLGQHNPIPNPNPSKRYILEHFYRGMRRHFDVLLTDQGEPEGGAWNFDHDNRKKLPRSITPPDDLRFEPDTITRAVMEEVDAIASGIGTVDGFGYAVTRAQALQVFETFLVERLEHFGAYEDALTDRSHTVFHSVLSPYLNIGLLEPMEVIRAVERAWYEGRAPINSVEGIIRQILGWREFMYWQYWRQMPGMLDKNGWNAQRPLPDFVWTGDTPMHCMSHAIRRAIDTGYNHHIERLMVLSNFFMLAGIEPRQVNDWFVSLYIDAYAWVMPPNVIGMSLNADGGLTATKPYISSANY
ncbi:MAG: cryptochrome/photolyase family protein, partial [Myxococcota bacterium]